MKDDLISRKGLKEEIGSLRMTITGTRERKGMILKYAEELKKTVMRCIEEAPAAEEKQGWIPVKERLPEESGTYRVTVSDNGIVIRISYMKWQSRLKRWEQVGRNAYCKVLAWEENPEPYNPEKE